MREVINNSVQRRFYFFIGQRGIDLIAQQDLWYNSTDTFRYEIIGLIKTDVAACSAGILDRQPI